VVGQARARTRAVPTPRAALEIAGLGPIDFVPTNRPALVRLAQPDAPGRWVVIPLEGAYRVVGAADGEEVEGDPRGAGFVALRFAYRIPSLPGALAQADLAIVSEPVQRAIHGASVPVALDASAASENPLVELVCGAGKNVRRIAPGERAQVPYADRDACRVVMHRERLLPADGAQSLHLDIDVTRVDGAPRPEARVSQSVVLRAGKEPRNAWVRGVSGPFDHVTIRLAHEEDHGAEAPASPESPEQGAAPSAQWSYVAGTGHARIYATTAVPTGLYRVADRDHSGILSLNFGVVARLTWLDAEGQGGFLGLETGVMGVGLANDTSSTGRSLTQVATVLGAGLGVPIANRSLATETSVNLHAWLEYEPSRDLGGASGSPLGFVFGPSLSIGNVGANL
jgi:hypothetical protein